MRKRKSKSSRIAEILMHRITSGTYSSDGMPSQRALAEEFTVSRNTIVEAINILETGGWITRLARHRSKITSRDDFSEKLRRFVQASRFQPPPINKSSSWLEEQNLLGKTDVIDLSQLCDEHWDGHINFDIEERVMSAALKRFKSNNDSSSIYETSGVLPLKLEIIRRLALKGVHAQPNEIVIIPRRLQAYRLVSEILLGQGSELWIPELSLARHYGVGERHTSRRRRLPVDEDGSIDFDGLWFSKGPKVVFLEPTRPKPTNRDIPADERESIVKTACNTDLLIFEDSYCNILYDSQLPLMASFDRDKKAVILLGAVPTWLTAIAGFSFIVANSKLIDLLNASIRRDYFTPELLTQLCATELLASNGIDEMLARFRVFHRQRIEDVNRILMSNLGDICSWSLPGSFGCIWLKVNECVNCDRMYRTRQDVNFHPGWLYGEPTKHWHHLLLRYTMPIDRFESGVNRLASLVQRCRNPV